MAYGFVCARCGRLELAHDGIITEADGELPSRIKLPGYELPLKKCKTYTASDEEHKVINRDAKKIRTTVYRPQIP
jgi:hypothetical protein